MQGISDRSVARPPATTAPAMMVEGNNTVTATEPREEAGRTKRKRVPRKQQADELNGCLCGDVVEPSTEGALKCKQAGCETEWVIIFYLL